MKRKDCLRKAGENNYIYFYLDGMFEIFKLIVSIAHEEFLKPQSLYST